MSTVRIQVRRGTASQWTSVNPILAAGEMGVESDSNLFKFGNGSSTWTALAYANNSDVAIGEISQDAINSALTMGSGLTKTYNDGANTITIAVDSSYFNELAQDAVNTALTAGTGITKAYDDAANTLTIAADTAVLATKEYVAAQRTSIQNTSDAAYLFAADLGAASGVASLNSSGKVPASQLDITETVQDVLGSTVVSGRGAGVVYNDPAGTLTLSTLITGDGSVAIANNAGDNGMTVSLTPIVDATTKLRTPLVEAGAVSTDSLSATTANLGALTISGNLTVNGTTTSINSTNYTVDDPMIYIGEGNQSNTLDLGIVAAFNNGTYQHSGLVRDASESVWKLFSGVAAEPGTTIDFTTYTKDDLQVGTIFANSAMIGNVSNTELQYLDGVTSAIQTQINSKLSTDAAASTYAPKSSPTLSNPTLTGVVTLPAHTITAAVIEDQTITDTQIANNAAIALSKISGLQSALAAKAYVASPTFTGTVSLPATTTIGTISATEIGYLTGVSSNVQTQINTTNTNLTSQVNTLGTSITNNYNNLSSTISANKTSADSDIASTNTTVGTLTTTVGTKAPIASPTFTGTVTVPTLTVTGSATGITSTMVGLGNVDNTSDANKPVSTAATTALALKAPLASPTFTGTVSGITKSMVGLGNVDNTADSAKPVSTAQQTALDLKANLASPTFTGTVTLPTGTVTSAMIADGAITDSDISLVAAINPVKILGLSTSLALKADVASPTFTGTPAAPTPTAGTNTTQVATTAFVKAAIDNLVNSAPGALDTLGEIATQLATDESAASALTTVVSSKAPLASPTFTGTVTLPSGTVSTSMVADSAITSAKIADGTIVDADINASAAIAQSKISGLSTSLGLKANLAAPSFTGGVTVDSYGIIFSDGTQTKAGVPSITNIPTAIASSATLATGQADNFVPLTGAVQITLPATGYTTGQSIDFYQASGTGASFATTNGVVGTPGLKFRTTYSVVTAMKISGGWLIFGDLSA